MEKIRINWKKIALIILNNSLEEEDHFADLFLKTIDYIDNRGLREMSMLFERVDDKKVERFLEPFQRKPFINYSAVSFNNLLKNVWLHLVEEYMFTKRGYEKNGFEFDFTKHLTEMVEYGERKMEFIPSNFVKVRREFLTTFKTNPKDIAKVKVQNEKEKEMKKTVKKPAKKAPAKKVAKKPAKKACCKKAPAKKACCKKACCKKAKKAR